MANPGWTGPISDLPMDDTGEVRTKRSLNRQADAKAGADQAFDAFAAYIMSHHFWPLSWRGKFGDNHVMNLMSGCQIASKCDPFSRPRMTPLTEPRPASRSPT